jgi:hypothetical protein
MQHCAGERERDSNNMSRQCGRGGNENCTICYGVDYIEGRYSRATPTGCPPLPGLQIGCVKGPRQTLKAPKLENSPKKPIARKRLPMYRARPARSLASRPSFRAQVESKPKVESEDGRWRLAGLQWTRRRKHRSGSVHRGPQLSGSTHQSLLGCGMARAIAGTAGKEHYSDRLVNQ